MSMNSEQYMSSLEKILSDEDLRIFVWRLIAEDCKVFQEGFPMNAGAYALLAVQDIGKRLLADLKVVDPVRTMQAEQEYLDFIARAMADNSGEEDGDY